MKNRKFGFVSLLLILVLAVGSVAVYKNSEALKGAFGGTSLSVLCPASTSLQTIYVKAGAAAGGTGTKIKPYNSILEAQTALETDATLDRVCFSGSLTGSLELNDALPTSLILTSYLAKATLTGSSSLAIELDDNNIDQLTIKNINIEGTLMLTPNSSLTLNTVSLDANSAATALWIKSTDLVSISNSEIEAADIGIYTSEAAGEEVGSLDIDDVEFAPIYHTAIVANFMDSLSVSESLFDYAIMGIDAEDVTALNVDKSEFHGGETGILTANSAVDLTELDIENNFFVSNAYEGIVSEIAVTGLVRNNSFYDNRVALKVIGAVNYINNVLYANVTQYAFGGTTSVASMTSDFNLFYGNVAPTATSLSTWQTLTSLDTHSLTGDPLFVSIDDLHLSSSSSPAIDAGMSLPTTSGGAGGTGVDIDGDTRPSGSFDIGADEY